MKPPHDSSNAGLGAQPKSLAACDPVRSVPGAQARPMGRTAGRIEAQRLLVDGRFEARLEVQPTFSGRHRKSGPEVAGDHPAIRGRLLRGLGVELPPHPIPSQSAHHLPPPTHTVSAITDAHQVEPPMAPCTDSWPDDGATRQKGLRGNCEQGAVQELAQRVPLLHRVGDQHHAFPR